MEYKKSLIDLGKSENEKKFIADCFSRWYLEAPRNGIYPKKNIVNVSDLEYGNAHKNCNFDIREFVAESEKIFKSHKKKKISIENMDNLIMPAQLERLKKIYTGKDFEKDKNELIYTYNIVGLNTIHLSIPPIFKGIELFGSPLNTHNPEYCSPFAIDKKFGSLGTFFEFTPQKHGILLCNPPFDENIIEKMANRLLEFLEQKFKLIIVITIPVWDSASQQEINIKDYGLDFAGFEILKNSKYCYSREILDKNEFPYWDYYSEKYIPASHTHLIFLSNLKSEQFKRIGLPEKITGAWKKSALRGM